MAIKTFNLPDPGEGLVEAEIVEWKVAPGDTVKVNDMVLEIETAKSLVELPIPWAGTVKELLVEVGQTVDVGTPIIKIDDGLGGDEAPAAPAAESAAAGPEQEAILVGYGAKAGATARRPRRRAEEAGAAPSAAAAAAAPAAPVATVAAPDLSAPTETEQVAEAEPAAEHTAPMAHHATAPAT